MFIQENIFENVISKMVAILSQPQCVENVTMMKKIMADTKPSPVDGLIQERCNSIANTLELHFYCTSLTHQPDPITTNHQ